MPQTERSRLDYPVSALDVALMGAVSRMPWWRRPSRADRRLATEALDRVGLADRAHVTFGELSGGQRQRVLVARALVQDAPLMLLDEPFSGLDTPSAERLEALLRDLAAEGRGLLMATHDIEQARGLGPRAVPQPRPGRVRAARRAHSASRRSSAPTAAALVTLGPGDDARAVLPPHHHEHDHA